MTERFDPLFTKTDKPEYETTASVQQQRAVPRSPISGKPMTLHRARSESGDIKMWADLSNRVVFPAHEDD